MDFLSTHRSRPWHHVGHRILRPFADPDDLNFTTPYCLECKSHVESQKEGRFEGVVYAFKEWCRQCGAIIRYAVYNQNFDASGGQRAAQWAMSPEREGV